MNLEQFIKKHKNQKEAAKVLGLSQGMISHRLRGRYAITADVALDLERRSGGEMTRYDLLPDVFGPKPVQSHHHHSSALASNDRNPGDGVAHTANN